MTGYSDRINHALAYAAKHHDQQVRRGTRLPYLARPANVGIILTRYGCDEDTVVAGILHEVVEDSLLGGWTRAMLESRLSEKFGSDALGAALAAGRRRLDEEGTELDRDERNADLVRRLATASDRARWVCSAEAVHSANTVLADLRRTVDPSSVWSRVHAGREATQRWFRELLDGLIAAGFNAPIVAELATAVAELEASP
jgi:(p)ppGpp synthase/HD superfamily hydrolase